jgi:hypothetical protein
MTFAPGKQSPIRLQLSSYNSIGGNCAIFERFFLEVMIKHAHLPLFQLVSVGGSLGNLLETLVLFHSLAVYSCQAGTLVV